MRKYKSFQCAIVFCFLIATLQGCANSKPDNSPTPSLDQQSIYVSSSAGDLYAINISNKTLRWKYRTPSGGINHSQIENGIMYFILDNDTNRSSTLYLLNTQNGALLRHYSLPYFVLEAEGFVPNFVVVHGIVYLSTPQMVFALNSSDGSQLWQYPEPGRGVSSPLVTEGAVYVVAPGIIYALKRDNGTLLWKYNLGPESVAPGSIAGSNPAPVMVKNVVYITGFLTDDLYAINAEDGSLRWHMHLNNETIRQLYVANGVIYVNTGGIYVLRPDNGAQLWHQDHVSRIAFIDDAALYVVTDDNMLEAIRATDGSILWHAQIASVLGALARYKSLYVSTDTTLYALHANDGTILWQLPAPGFVID